MSRVKYYTFCVYFTILAFVSLHFVFEAGLSYAKEDGCLRAASDVDSLNGEYKALYAEDPRYQLCTRLTN